MTRQATCTLDERYVGSRAISQNSRRCPPRFYPGREVVVSAKRLCFRGLPQVASDAGEFALASLVHHLDYLLAELPRQHPLFQNPLLKNNAVIAQLRDCLVAEGEVSIVATGIPPHVALLSEMKAMKEALLEQQQAMKEAAVAQEQAQERVVQRMMDGMTSILEQRAAETGVPTCDRLAASVMSRLADAGLLRLLDRLDNGDSDECTGQSAVAQGCESALADAQRSWTEMMPQFPPGYTLPRGTTDQAWLYWCCGDQSLQTPPLRRLDPSHLPTTNDRKRLSDLKFLMQRLENRATELGLSTSRVTMEEAAAIYDRCKGAIELTEQTHNGRKRRRGQLVWITVATEVRKSARLSREALVAPTTPTEA